MYEINETIAGIVPMALQSEQDALNADVKSKGLLTPIVLWKGKIVDGRCRQIACRVAGIEPKVEELGWDMEESRVISIVKSLNTRRNLTMTQKCMSAIKYYYNSKGTRKLEDVGKEWGVSRQTIINVNYIYKFHREFIEPLFNGDSVEIKDANGVYVKTNKVNSICMYLKRIEEEGKLRVVSTEENEWNPDSKIKTQAGKDWYKEVMNGIDELRVRLLLVEMANMKFKVGSDE